jgi:pilus biogenesis lipoprotein CpaD
MPKPDEIYMMMRRLPTGTLALLSVAALALGGCEPTAPAEMSTINYQAPPRDVLATETKTTTIELHTRSGGTLSISERRRLDAWLASFGRDRPGSIHAVIRGPGSREQLHSIAMELIAVGVEPQKIEIVSAQPSNWRRRGEPVIITAARAIAILPNCPGWIPHVSGPDDNRAEPNLGCSDTSNLAAMIVDPTELREGQSTPYHDGEVGALAVGRYRSDKVKQLPSQHPVTTIGGPGGATPQEGNSQGTTSP